MVLSPECEPVLVYLLNENVRSALYCSVEDDDPIVVQMSLNAVAKSQACLVRSLGFIVNRCMM
jgi:hypothetical protein